MPHQHTTLKRNICFNIYSSLTINKENNKQFHLNTRIIQVNIYIYIIESKFSCNLNKFMIMIYPDQQA